MACKNCGKPVFTDGEDFWKWDPDTQLFRMVDFYGKFYPEQTHPGATEKQIVEYYGSKINLATEVDIMWRSINMIVEGLRENRIL